MKFHRHLTVVVSVIMAASCAPVKKTYVVSQADIEYCTKFAELARKAYYSIPGASIDLLEDGIREQYRICLQCRVAPYNDPYTCEGDIKRLSRPQ